MKIKQSKKELKKLLLEKKDKQEKELKDTFEVKNPLKDYPINFPRRVPFELQIMKGEAVSVPKIFKQTLINTGVILEKKNESK